MNITDFDIGLLALATICTSGFAAVLGQGGGIMLFALLAIYIEPPMLIAFHGFIQLCSNSSRAALATSHIKWQIISPILLGTLAGTIFIIPFIKTVNWNWMQPIMGSYILYLTWGNRIKLPFHLPNSMFGIGIFQGSLGMALGATGPLGNALLLAKGLGKDALIASSAVIMSISHFMKVILFSLLGVSLWHDIGILTLLSISAIIGSFIGSKLRGFLPEKTFDILFRLILTALAMRMIFTQYLSFN